MTQRIDDGHPTFIQFTGANTTGMGGAPGAIMTLIWEKKVKPVGISGGGENDTTTMRNLIWRTRQAKKLKTLTDMTVTVSYDPKVYADNGALLFYALNINQQIIIWWPDGSKLTFWGFLDEFMPGEIVEGAQPEAELKIIATNQNNAGVEQYPIYTP
jgi:hypothetical protein